MRCPTSAPRLAPHLRQDSPRICAGTRPTSAPRLSPHLRRDSPRTCAGTMRRLVAREGRSRRRCVVRYSLKNAADAAGFYNDIGLDCLAREHPTVAFVHAAPVRNE